MNRRAFAQTLALGPAALAAAQTSSDLAAPPETYRSISPLDVSNKAQLFVDRVLVRETRDVSFQLHPGQPHPNNPLVVADKPWEGWRLEIFGSVIYDEEERLYKMWYIGEPVGVFGPAPKSAAGDNPTLYATSADGIHWDKPLLNILPTRDGAKTNALLYATHLASVRKDREESDPVKRYKMTCYVHDPKEYRGYQTMVSPDGLHWTRHSKTPICTGSDVVTSYYDERRKLWVALAKISTLIRGHTRRVFYTVTSKDFDTWTQPKLALYPDLADDAGSLARVEQARTLLDVPDDPNEMRTEFYGTGFYAAESCTLGFPWVFTINNRARYGNQEGPFELQLAVTRDLFNWERPFRIPCVPRGKTGDWECGIQQTSASAIRVGDEIRLYYCGANYTHGTPVLYRPDDPRRKTKYTGSIGLATWKVDRFVSANGHSHNSQLDTVPVTFSGEKLELNARTSSGGALTVELLDPAGRTLEEDWISQPVKGDNLRHIVKWSKHEELRSLKGRPVSIRFHLNNAELFSFAFRNA